VVQQSYLRVDERGTEVSSAAAIGGVAIGITPEANTFRANHPFVFLIRDNATNTALFIGHVVDPTSN
jgi:serpin B